MPAFRKLNLITKYFIFPTFLLILILSIFLLNGSDYKLILVVMISILSFVIFTAIFLNHEVTNPLTQLKEISVKLFSGGPEQSNLCSDDLDKKLNELTEISDKLIKFNFKNSFNKETVSAIETITELTEQLKSEISTARTFKINRNEFLGNVAHELRTPIFAIQLALETLLDGAIDDKRVNKDFLERANKQAGRMKELVDNLISISKIETGMKLSRRYFCVGEYIKEIISGMKDLAAGNKSEILFMNKTSSKCEIFADAEQLKHVFINLIGNAIKFSHEGSNVIVRAIERRKDVLFEVEDSGIGIPAKDIPRIFERFYRIDKNRSRDRGGSGLGLSIVKHILEIHSTSISVSSSPGNGSVFRFAIPK